MGLETDITDIQSLNQNWPPVSDPRAQGADHIRNIKKAIQLTFPNLKQCLLNDAQFTALGTLIGDGSGTFTINGKLTVSDTLTVPTVTDWTTQQAVGAKDAEGRYLKPGDADGRYVRNIADDQGGIVSATMDASGVPSFKSGAGNWYLVQLKGDYATNAALTDAKNSCLANNNPGISGALAGTSLCVNPADGLPYLAYNGNSKIIALALDSAKVNKADGTMSALNVEINGGSFQMNNAGAPGYASWFRDTGTADDGVLDIYSNVGGSGTNVLRITSDGGVRILGSGTFQKNGTDVALKTDLPFLDTNLRVQVFSAIATDGTFVRIPQAFRTLVGVTAQQHSSGNEGIRPIRIETNVFRGDGFNVSIWSSGGGIQYTFVAYGYF